MKNKLIGLCLAALAGLFFISVSFAASKNYLMWQLPTSAYINYPVYVYSNNAQVAYVPSNTLQVFAGQYQPGQTNASYALYYQDAKENWYSCSIVLKNGSINQNKTTCPGAVINPPVHTSNVYTIAMGAYAWPAAASAPVSPTAHSYSKRTITFYNNTEYSVIQVGESCSTSGNTPGTCQTALNIADIPQGQSFVITVDESGLNSAAFYVTKYCTSAAADCYLKPGVKNESNWISTGGYGPGETPYAIKIEPTILPVTNGVPNGASNIDISAVDGYNFGAILYPQDPYDAQGGAYCTYTVPPENSNVLGAGYYSKQAPLAFVKPTAGIASLQTLCANSSQLPANYSGKDKPWNLSKLDSNNNFQGCMSPCTYATINYGTGSPQANLFCCPAGSPYGTPATCDAGANGLSASTSTYTTNVLNSSEFQNVYPFSYGDAGSDYGCSPATNFVVSFVTSASVAPTFNITQVAASNITQNSATINWKSVDSDPNAGNITYTVTATPTSGSPIIQTVENATTLNLAGLTANTAYSVVVSGIDSDGNKATSTASTFTTTTPSGGFTIAQPIVGHVAYNSAVISWTATDNDPKANPITYKVTATPDSGEPIVQTVKNTQTALLTGLTPGMSYVVDVTGVDNDKNTAKSPNTTLKTPVKPEYDFSIFGVRPGNIGVTSATLNWDSNDTDPNANPIKYTVVLTSNSGAVNEISAGSSKSVNLTDLTPSTTYSAIVSGVDADGNTANSPVATFTTESAPPYHFTITQPVAGEITQTTAVIGFTGTDTDPKAGNIQYTATATSSDGGTTVTQAAQSSDFTLISGLTPGKTYTVVVTGKDSDGNTATSPASAPFTMGAYAFTITQPVVSGVTQTTANVGFTATDSDPNGNPATFTATATSTDGGATVTQAVPQGTTQLTGFTPGKTYTVVVTGVDQDKNTATSPASAPFTTAASYVFTIGQPTVTNVAQTTATVNWTASDNDPNANPITYTVTATPSSGSPVVQTVQNADTLNLTGLTANTAYTVVVTGADSDNNTATSQSASFTTQAAAQNLPVQYDSSSNLVYWRKVPGETCGNTTSPLATPVTGGAAIAGTLECSDTSAETAVSFGPLTAGQAYVISVTINGQLYQGQITP